MAGTGRPPGQSRPTDRHAERVRHTCVRPWHRHDTRRLACGTRCSPCSWPASSCRRSPARPRTVARRTAALTCRQPARGQGPRPDDGLHPRPLRRRVGGRRTGTAATPATTSCAAISGIARCAPGRTAAEITSGTLADPYTGTSIRYVRGHSRVDIDHVVALGDAWQMGAARWATAERVAFANDPLNLLAVSSSANRQKGDADAASWLPHTKAFRCSYVARQVAVKLRYRLAATSAERAAMRRVLDGLPRSCHCQETGPPPSPSSCRRRRQRPIGRVCGCSRTALPHGQPG